jgi:4-diphosphocytidyl-2-C-methyl-D-erythritol kinase
VSTTQARPALDRLAPAKVNLFLHVGPVDAEGYHPLASLVAFADVGDVVTVQRAAQSSLTVIGPFGAALEDEGDNLMSRALRALAEVVGADMPPLAVTLDKRLPIAAGLGGGSSDVGAALKAASEFLALDLTDATLAEVAATTGADGAMCLHARSAWAEGRGEVLSFEPRLPPLAALLVNPGAPSPTGSVYHAYDGGPTANADRPAPPEDWSAASVIDWLADQRNDLQAPAVALQPAIAEALQAVEALTEVRLTRMSGSGATVFGLFDSLAQARAAGEALTQTRPGWWIMPTTMG